MANQYYRPDQDIYSMLGLPPDTPREVVYSTARQAMLRHHPDQGGDPYAFRWCKWAADLAGQEFFWGLWSQERAAYWRSPLRRLFRRPSAPVSLAAGGAAQSTVTGGPVPMAISRPPDGPGPERPHAPRPEAALPAVISPEALAVVAALPWGAWHVLVRRLALALRREAAEAEAAWVARLQAWARDYLARRAEARRRKAAIRMALRYIASFEKEAPQWMQMHGGKLTKTYTEKKHRTVPAANGRGTKTVTYTVQTKVALFRGLQKKRISPHDDVLWEMHLLPIYPHISDVVHDSDTAQIHDRWEKLIFDEKNLRELVDQPDLGGLNANLEVTTKSHYLVVQVRDAQAPAAAPEAEPAAPPEPEALRPGGPPLALLAAGRPGRGGAAEGQRAAQALQAAISSFVPGVTVTVAGVGPTVIRLALRYPAGTPASRITGRAGDLVAASGGALQGLRFLQSGLSAEVVRSRRDVVALRSLLAAPAPRGADLVIPVGADAAGQPLLADLAAAPHVLCAGTTGGGKSVWLHTVLLGLLMRYTPQELRLALVDPKQVELAMYSGLPHLLAPIATAPDGAMALLSMLRAEMERRYGVLRTEGARDIGSHNSRHPEAPWPRIVAVADETYDLRLGVQATGGREALAELDACITSLAQKARAAGVSLVITTQKPTIEAIPSLLRGNLPTRMALRVTTTAESGVALDEPGAELLAGRGDALWKFNGAAPVRVQSGFASEEDIAAVVQWCRQHDPDPGPLLGAGEEERPGGSTPEPAPAGPDYDSIEEV